MTAWDRFEDFALGFVGAIIVIVAVDAVGHIIGLIVR